MSKNYKSRRRGKGYPARELKTPKLTQVERYELMYYELHGGRNSKYKIKCERLEIEINYLEHCYALERGATRKEMAHAKELRRKIDKQKTKIDKLKRNLAIVTPKKEDKLAGTQIARIMKKI